MNAASPPRLAGWLIGALVPARLRHAIRADLAERFDRIVETEGVRAARRWYWRQLLLSVKPGLLGAFADRFGTGSMRAYRERADAEAPRRGKSRGWLGDVRFAFRGFLRSPGFTVAALTILLLGIGGSTAVFTVVNAVLLRPLPYDRPHELVVMWSMNTRQGLPDGSSAQNARDWLDRSHTLADLALFVRPEFTTATVSGPDAPERVHVGVVTWNFFDVLGTSPIAGRPFDEQDQEEDHLVVISESYWRNRFGRAPETIGRTVHFNGVDYRIVGVVSADVGMPRPATMIWQLHDPDAPGQMVSRRNDSYVVLGRLASSATVEDAQRDLDGVADALAADYPETNRNLGIDVRSLRAEVVGERLPQVLWMLFGAVLVVLLVAASNVAHLALARGAQRRREFAIRTALGASRWRMIRLLVIESAVLAVVAGIGGVLLGNVALEVLLGFLPGDMPRLDGIRIDGSVLVVAIGAVAVVGPAFGLIPAVLQTRVSPADALAAGGRGSAGGVGRSRFRRALVVAEVAMAVILLAQAGLFVRSVRAIQSIDPGFDPEVVLVAQLDVDRSGRDRQSLPALFGEFVTAVRGVPGVADAGVVDDFFIRRFPDVSIRVEGAPPAGPDDPVPPLTVDWVFPGFFEAMDLAPLDGRTLHMSDIPEPGTGGPRDFVINRAMADVFWPGESAVGKRFTWGDSNDPNVVVGVVPNLRRGRLEEAPFPQAFAASVTWGMDLLVRVEGDPLALSEGVRRAIHSVDPATPVSRVGTAWMHFGESMAERRVQAWLLGLFSLLATLIAAVGLFALLHDGVVHRRREIGIRIALGANPGSIRGLMIREGLALSGIGLVFGLVGAAAASGVTRSMLYGITSRDPLTLVGVSALLVVVTLTASWLPARRATRVQPVETLGSE